MITGWCKLKVRARVEILIKHFFSNDIYFSFVRPNCDKSDIVMCYVVGQIVVANKTLSVLICLYYH